MSEFFDNPNLNGTYPNSPFDLGISSGFDMNEHQQTNVAPSFEDDPFCKFSFGASNDFESSAGGIVAQNQFHLPPPAPAPKQQILQKPAQPVVSLSPNPDLSQLHIMPKSTDFTLEPEKFKIKSKPKPSRNIEELDQKTAEFNSVCLRRDVLINPNQISLLPTTFWVDGVFTFGDIVESYFKLKNNSNARFHHKLYNGLKITESNPFFVPYIGLSWVNDLVFKVDTAAFGRLLGIKHINPSLFNKGGNFPTHGFVEIMQSDLPSLAPDFDPNSIDFMNVKLLYHNERQFLRTSTESDIANIKWTPSVPKS